MGSGACRSAGAFLAIVCPHPAKSDEMKRLTVLALLAVFAFDHTGCGSNAADTKLPVLVVVGLNDEAKIAQGPGVEVVLSAANGRLLRDRLKAYDRTKVRAVVSFGISGGLDPALQPGDLTLPTTVVSGTGAKWAVSAMILLCLKQEAEDGGINFVSGIEVSTEELSDSSPEGRAALRKATGGDGVDMESHIAAQFAQAQGLPFAVIRAVADPYDFTLPPAALTPLNPDGTINLPGIVASILRNPGQIPALIKLSDYYQASLRTLKTARQAIDLGKLAVPRAGCRRTLRSLIE